MAIVLEANYAKKLGLPNYSSHQYCVTIRTELTDLSQVEAESARLYRLLQDAVDKEIVEVGYLPDATIYGMNKPNGNGPHADANGANGDSANRNGEDWNCTDGQRGFILRIVNESKLNKDDVEGMAQQLSAPLTMSVSPPPWRGTARGSQRFSPTISATRIPPESWIPRRLISTRSPAAAPNTFCGTTRSGTSVFRRQASL